MNPQLAAWSHSPFANEVEKYMVDVFGGLFAYKKESIDGVFASGGAEANFTAILCALNHRYPELGNMGLQGINQQPRIYCSSETHHSVVRGARLAGLGKNAVCPVASDKQQRIFPERLLEAITQDRQNGFDPVLVVATAGTTGTGAIDDLEQIGFICKKQKLWYHVDAAYGGACIINPHYSKWIKGIELSDSLIVDLHKWLSVPMASSLFITQNPDILHRTFGIKTGYMPKDAGDLQITDPFAHSFQWSRRFSGLKIYLSLLMYGLDGFSNMIATQVELAEYFRVALRKQGWSIINDSPLPVVCFTDEKCSHDQDFARFICDGVVKSGKAWISVYPIEKREVLRACITNYNTNDLHINSLTDLLCELREKYRYTKGSAGKQ
jgi:glutamate/tyrosine decarboxylase-like PLP-dependent enzyme